MTSHLQDHYDDFYSGTSKWREIGAKAKFDNLFNMWSASHERPPENVLEIGCGEGAVLAAMKDVGWQVQGVEISRSGAEAASRRGLDVTLYDGTKIPFDDGHFEFVVLTHVVEHFENPRSVLNEATRVGRTVFVEVPLEYHWRTPRNFRWTDLGHINLYNMKLIRHLLQSVGLSVTAEGVFNPSLEAYRFQKGTLKGTVVWSIRQAALRLLPPIAHRMFVYHGALLCTNHPGIDPVRRTG